MVKGMSKKEFDKLDEEELREMLDEMIKKNKEEYGVAVKMGVLGMDYGLYQRYVDVVDDIQNQVDAMN